MVTRLSNIELEEVSLVDKPANEGSKVLLFKAQRTTGPGGTDDHTHTYDDEEGGLTSETNGHQHAVTVNDDGTVEIGPPTNEPDGHTHEPADVNKRKRKVYEEQEQLVKSIIDVAVADKQEAEGVQSFEEILDENDTRRRQWEAMEAMWPLFNALQESLQSIAADDDMDDASKVSRMRTETLSFLAEVESRFPEVAEELSKFFVGLGDNKGESVMPPKKKTVDELLKENASLKEQLDTLKAKSEGDDENTELKAKFDELSGKLDELQTALETVTAEKEKAEKLAELTDDQKAYYETLDEAGQKAFLEVAADKRDAEMKKAADGDETIEVDGRTIRKSIVGDDVFETMKSQEARLAQNEAAITKEREGRRDAEIRKRIDDQFSHLPGENDDKLAAFKAIDGLDAASKKAVETMLVAGEKAIKAAFESLGTRNPDDPGNNGDGQKFKQRVSEIKRRDGCSQTQAMAKARKEHPDDFAAYQEEAAASSN